MTPDDTELDRRAHLIHDHTTAALAGRRDRRAEDVPPLTTDERTQMHEFIVGRGEPAIGDLAERSDLHVAISFLGARRRAAQLAEHERQQAVRDERDRRDAVERAAVERDHQIDAAYAAAKGKLDFREGMRDGELFAAARAEAMASVAEVRRTIAENHRRGSDPAEDEIAAALRRNGRWRS